MKYAIEDIIQQVDGVLLNATLFSREVEHLLLDSRQVIFPETALFFAIAGKRHNGHSFIPAVYQKGVRTFIVSEQVSADNFPGANFILVKDSLSALQQLAARHRQQFDIPVIGITGSNGKTIVKEWLFQLLREDYSIVRSPKSYNSQVGVPISVWQMAPQHQLAIFEAGISQKKEMEKLAPIIRCDIGLFTNIGAAHAEGFSSTEEKIREKLQLFSGANILIYGVDDPRVQKAVSDLNIPTFSWSREDNAGVDLQIEKVSAVGSQQTILEGKFHRQPVRINIPFIDAASVENAIHCWATLLYLGVPQPVITERMLHLEPVAMRLELKAGINNCTVINDSYNSDLNSLDIALQFLDQQRQQPLKTLILSDILQSGQPSILLYQQVAKLIQQHDIHRFIGIGSRIPVLKSILPRSVKSWFYPSTSDFLQALDLSSFGHEAILLKGARHFGFEKIAQTLAEKVHRTALEVHLNALIHNLNVYHQKLDPDTKLMVMVKAAAYGSGSLEVARILEFHQVDYLAVAYADEGAELREGGIQLPIMVLNPEEAVFETLIRYQLEPEIYSPALLQQFAAFTAELTAPFPIHLKVETGMNRLGFELDQADFVITTLQENPQLQVRSIFSHLAASDDSAYDRFTQEQVEHFLLLYRNISDGIGYRPVRHILNSSGISRFPQYQMDMVRLGIGIYGIDSSESMQHQLQTVLHLKATVSQIKHLNPGQSVGYGRVGKVDRPMRLATISIGYADGLRRAAGQGRYQLAVKGQLAPIVGNVCMDMCMIDVTDIPACQEGDEVIVFGTYPKVETLAQVLGTIPYEVFTSISPRVKRVYVQE